MIDINKVLAVINPISGNKDKDEMEKILRQEAEEEGVSISIFNTTGENDIAKLSKVIKKENPACVLAIGGDGTTNLVAKTLIDKTVYMSIIPAGSANGMAREFNIPENIKGAIKRLLHGNEQVLDLININKDLFSLHLSDMGLNARVIKRFEEESLRGLRGYAKQYFKELHKIQPTRYSIHVKDKTIKTKAIMLVLANGTRYGTGAQINPLGSPSDGEFELLIIEPYPWWAIFSFIGAFFIGKIHMLKYVRMIKCTSVTIECSTPQYTQVDGETVGKNSKISAKILPACLKFIIPQEV
jgi:YegS/Rv2252/BmrU family lipid kinase